jgi:hypothetical protein
MQAASTQAVLGNFDDAKFVYEGVTTTFFKKGSDFWVNTDNENGELQDYPVEYVFGVYPLQQLLLPTKNGSLNALSIAWDSRSAAEGGKGGTTYTKGRTLSPRKAHFTGRAFTTTGTVGARSVTARMW